jgi:hypothetical protein
MIRPRPILISITQRMALVVAATTIFSGCAGILVCTGYPGIGPDRDFKLDMTRAEVEEKLGFPYGEGQGLNNSLTLAG